MIGVVAADVNPVPFAFLAATVNVYCALFVRPEIVRYGCGDAKKRAACATPALYGVTT